MTSDKGPMWMLGPDELADIAAREREQAQEDALYEASLKRAENTTEPLEPEPEDRAWCKLCLSDLPTEAELDDTESLLPDGMQIEDCRQCGGLRIWREE